MTGDTHNGVDTLAGAQTAADLETPVRRTLIVCCLAFLAALIWRAPLDGRRDLALVNNDCVYHLARAEQCLADYPRVRTVDRYSHYPTRFRNHWPTPHALFYATVAKLTGTDRTDRTALVARLSWVPPILGGIAICLALLIAAAVRQPQAGAQALVLLITGVTALFSQTGLAIFGYGAIDHHLFACLGIECLVLARLRRQFWLWLAGLLAMLAMTPAASLYASVFMGLLFIAEATSVCQGTQGTLKRGWQWFMAPAAACLIALVCHRRLDPDPIALSAMGSTYLTLFQVLWFTVIGAGMSLCLQVLPRVRERRGARAALLVFGVSVLAIAAVALCILQLSGQLETVWGRLSVARRMPVSEELRPLGSAFVDIPYSIKFQVLVAVFLAVRVAAVFRTRHRAETISLLFFLLGALALGFMEFRFLRAVSMLASVATAMACVETARALARSPRLQSSAGRVAPVALAALLLAPLLAADVGMRLLRIVTQGVAAESPEPVPMKEALAWLKANTPDPGARFGETPRYGVFCSWTWGHHVNVLGERPVVIDPFNHVGVAEPSARVWLSRDDDQLAENLLAYNARYLVIDAAGREVVSMVAMARHDVSDLYAIAERLPGRGLFLAPVSRFAAFRLYAGTGCSPLTTRLQPRFFSETERPLNLVRPDGRVRTLSVPAVQVYEVKPGAVLEGKMPAGVEHVALICRLRWLADQRDTRAIRIELSQDSEGRFRCRTALPAPVQETSFVIDRGYMLSAGKTEVEVPVSQEAVDTGATIEVLWPE